MKYGKIGHAIAALLLSSVSLTSSAVSITYANTSLGGNTYKAMYNISVGATDPAVSEFTIYFYPGYYANLVQGSTPAGYDPLLVQPSTTIPADGYLDIYAFTPIPAGGTTGPFVVNFDFIGVGVPSSQPFDIVDPNTFDTISSGRTTLVGAPAPNPGTVPEPDSALLMLAGVFGLMMQARRKPWLESVKTRLARVRAKFLSGQAQQTFATSKGANHA